MQGFRIPLNSPVHGSVGGDEGRSDIEDLVSESAPDVEDSSVSSAGHGPLSVGGEGVGNDTLLRGRATWKSRNKRSAHVLRVDRYICGAESIQADWYGH